MVERNRVVTQYGEIIEFETSSDLKAILFRENLLGFCAIDYLTLPWVEGAILAGEQANYSDHACRILGISFKEGSRIRHVSAATAWPGLAPENLDLLDELFDYCEAGPYTTPASLGQALMRRLWPGDRPLRHPPWQAWRDIKDNIIGGRSELYYPDVQFSSCTEEDQNNAYAHAIKAIPAGMCMSVSRRVDLHRYAWHYGQWGWRTSPIVDVPILGYREGNRAHYPHLSDWRTGWFTKEEIEAASTQAYELRFLRGWGWTETRSSFSTWANHLDWMKQQLPAPLKDWLKLAIVGAIGRFGVDRQRWDLYHNDQIRKVSDETFSKCRILTECKTGAQSFYAFPRRHTRPSPENLIHISAKVHADVRLSTMARAAPYLAEGRLIAVNFDAIYYHGAPLQIPLGTEAGEWKRETIEDAKFPARRWVIATKAGEAYVKTPGKAKEINPFEPVAQTYKPTRNPRNRKAPTNIMG